ncbi:MAG TPA: YceI family protein [Polyangiaceae bacterium]|nr:YceI family protein [Polyangiaceae bacterium]
MTSKHRWFFTAFAASALVVLAAEARVESVGDASATFDAAGPGGLNIHGSTDDLVAGEQAGKIEVKVALGSLTTGIALRDSHMKEKYLEVAKFPDARVVVERSQLKFPTKGAAVRDQVAGAMTIHGVTRSVTLEYAASTAGPKGDRIVVTGSAPIDIRDFGIEAPSYLGVGVDPHVTLKVRFKVLDR